MRVGIYARVSTSDQNCEVQLAELRKYAVARDWLVAEEFVDSGWSGAKDSRPALNRLMKAALGRKIDTILVYKLDRWGRSLIHLLTSLSQLSAAGVRFIAITQCIDTDANNPMSRLMVHVIGAFAEFEREIIKERVAAGMARAKVVGTKSGKPVGRPVRIMDRQAIRDRRAEGATYTELMKQFNLGRGHVQRVLAPVRVADRNI